MQISISVFSITHAQLTCSSADSFLLYLPTDSYLRMHHLVNGMVFKLAMLLPQARNYVTLQTLL